ncbi:MAG: tyrosine-type recombinase/integrase [Nostocaceae cyanobacterium]|nr:tyrosine-type recombinase/integrase [Nostocaceae cyanobacterium]
MLDKSHSILVLESSLVAKIGGSFPTLNNSPDVLQQLLSDKRSPNTRRAYEKDLQNFFMKMTGFEPTQDRVLEFLHLEQQQAVMVVLKYKAELIQAGLKEATVNRRLAALKSLVKMGRKLGVCAYTLEDVQGERVRVYRDTTGVSKEDFSKLLSTCARFTPVGKRDYALLRLLWSGALRRSEVCQALIKDFDPLTRTLRILGKGAGTQYQIVDLGEATTDAICIYLKTRGKVTLDAPLFVSVDFYRPGHGLTGDGLTKILKKYCQLAGIKRLSPHRVRHSSITAALDATGGNIRKVQKLSRHVDLRTLMIYDDNRQLLQKEMSDLLDSLV